MTVGPDLSKFSVSQLAEITGRDRRWLKKRLARQGIEPVPGDKRALKFRARAALEAVYGCSSLDAGEELALLNRAKRELAELELAERRGEQAPIGEIEEVVASLYSTVRTQLLAIPAATAQDLAETDDPACCHAVVEEAIVETLTAIADAKIVTARARPPKSRKR